MKIQVIETEYISFHKASVRVYDVEGETLQAAAVEYIKMSCIGEEAEDALRSLTVFGDVALANDDEYTITITPV